MVDINNLTTENTLDNNIQVNGDILALPAIANRTKMLFPNVYTKIDIGRAKSLAAINEALKGNKLLFVVNQKDNGIDDPLITDLYEYGVVCRINTLNKTGLNSFVLPVECLFVAKILACDAQKDFFYFTVESIYPVVNPGEELDVEGAFRLAKDRFSTSFMDYYKNNRDTFRQICGIENPNEFINSSSFYLPFNDKEKLSLLSSVSTKERVLIYNELLYKELEINEVKKRVAENVKANVEKGQKEFYLREELRAIHEELGDNEQENQMLEQEIKNKHLPKEDEEKVLKELFRMTRMNVNSPDYSVIRSYLEWIIDLPFNQESKDTELLADCEKILEEDHFGLEKVKKRIIEYLAVLKLTKSLRGPILCLVGPPGVGKTSVAKSVARALGRKLVRMSLGGVKDEAEIRGHRKTYIGAMPGRIIYGMKEAGTSNPVFLLDEIDKLSSDMRGDPASALLEVLDPEQNDTFRDRYLEIPYDLSKVMFITTANSIDTIPAPLYDRMEVIELSGYTLEEKVEICKRYLIPKQIKMNGLKLENISFNTSAIKLMIEGYTGEAGVRKLEQQVGSVCRKVATMVADNPNKEKQVITNKNLTDYLGAVRYLKDSKIEKDGVGSATGLAWTLIGGTTLTIEVALMKGKGNLLLTGKLGDVMQESAKIAISYIRANAKDYNIDSTIFDETDIHLHVPEGATPKDGPSAGITIATAILSAFTGRKVKRDIAMTGEITLRGNVLPIGGLKEKSLAAYRLGIRKIVIPKANVKDLEEIPKEIAKTITFVPVQDVNEVFKNLLYEK